nr:hypothetical protein [Mycoplasmopsis bovis]
MKAGTQTTLKKYVLVWKRLCQINIGIAILQNSWYCIFITIKKELIGLVELEVQ